MHTKLYIYTALLVGLIGAGTTLAFTLPNNGVRPSPTLTAQVSCCPDGACCPDGPCCDFACCPDGPCCPDGDCCGLAATETAVK